MVNILTRLPGSIERGNEVSRQNKEVYVSSGDDQIAGVRSKMGAAVPLLGSGGLFKLGDMLHRKKMVRRFSEIA